MGVLNLKGVLAMFFGLITPFWIVLGMGIAAPADFNMPQLCGIWDMVAPSAVTPLLVLVAVIAVMGIVLAVMNLMTIMNYRMQTRVYNAFFVFMLVMAVIALCVDFGDATVYLPLLSLMVAVQIAHAHTLRATPFRYVFILLLIVGSITFYTVQLLLP